MILQVGCSDVTGESRRNKGPEGKIRADRSGQTVLRSQGVLGSVSQIRFIILYSRDQMFLSVTLNLTFDFTGILSSKNSSW